MCAIFGSFDTSMFEVLYEGNKKRGNFASSIVSLSPDDQDQYIRKKKGNIDFDKYTYEPNSNYYLGHVQAPTSANRKWEYDTSHPFESLSWLVSHNGVLTNHKQLRKQHCSFIENTVDTAVIVNVLEYFTQITLDESNIIPEKIIKSTLELLRGTFALSIIFCDTNEVFIARSGSILHYNNKGDYSTMGGVGFKELQEGVIMKLNNKTKRWNKVSKFKFHSPFSFV